MCRERKDSLGEEKVNKFLREHLYGGKYGLVKTRYSLDGSKVVRYETVTEKIRQSAGEDMLLHMDDKRVVVIDEKAALYYPNPRKTINTFAFELKTKINAHGNNQGWLFGKYDEPDYLEKFMDTTDNDYYRFNDFYKGKGIRLMRNIELPEKPINIVIDKGYLKKIAELHIESYFNKAPKKIY